MMNESTENTYEFKVENLSSKPMTTFENNVLSKGLKYATVPKPNYFRICSDVENAAYKISNNIDKKHFKMQAQIIVENYYDDKLMNRLPKGKYSNVDFKKLKSNLLNSNRLALKSDKGNTLVVLDNNQYDTKMLDIIKQLQAVQVKTDPTKQYLTNMRRVINSCSSVMSDETKKGIINVHTFEYTYAPYINGFPKIHKKDVPLRPVVNYRSAPTYRLAKFLLQQFNMLIDIPETHTIKNSIDFVQKINSVAIDPNDILISLDITSMYSNILIQDCLNALTYYLKNSSICMDEIDIEEYCNLTKLVISQNYFQYKGNFYTQKEGLPMGSPLSGYLANIVMCKFENDYILTQFKDNIKFWSRYVDDTLSIFRETDDIKVDQFLEILNSKHETIKFTLEKEINSKINFLDISITKCANKLDFSIYRKPTNNDRYIDGFSSHPYIYKYSAIDKLVHRAFSIPMSVYNLHKELDYIRVICQKNNLDEYVVDRLANKQSIKKKITMITKLKQLDDDRIRSKFVYQEGLSEKLATLCKCFGIIPVFSNNNSLATYLPRTYQSNSSIHNQGVYCLNCTDCNAKYIGQTGVSFLARYKQHNSALRNNHPDLSNFAHHILTTGHNPDISMENNFKILENESNFSRRLFLETCYIRKYDVDPNTDCVNAIKYPLNSNSDLLKTAIRLDKYDYG